MDSEDPALVSADFRLFSDLLEEMQDQVSARASYPVKQEEKLLLDRMVAGECSKAERAQAVEMVVANQEAMAYLASALKGEAHEGA